LESRAHVIDSIALETFRTDSWVIFGVATAAWVGIIGFVLAATWFVIRHRRGWGMPLVRPPDDSATNEDASAAGATARKPRADAEALIG
jgi:hypothetical protein